MDIEQRFVRFDSQAPQLPRHKGTGIDVDAVGAQSAQHSFAARGAGSVTLNHSTVRSELLKAFLELHFFEQKIGYQAAEARILDL